MITWEILEKACYNCKKCELYKSRNNVVIGDGPRNAKIMFVGEGPGGQEDLIGHTFVGPAGGLLDKMIDCIGLTRNDIYISNIVKCRPPGNRNPKKDEQEACISYLRAQYVLLKPKIIVCLGRIAAQMIIDPMFKITKDHGKWIERADTFITATYHPAALLRYPINKKDAYEDLKIIRNKIDELNISLVKEQIK